MNGARLNRLTDPSLREKSERYESFRDGGGGMVLKADVILKDVLVAEAPTGVDVEARHDGAFVEGTCRALGLPEDWAEYGLLRTRIRNGAERLKIEFSLLGARNRMVERRWLEPRESVEIAFDLRDLPLIAGRRPPYQPTGLRLRIQWGETWPTDGEWLLAGGCWLPTESNKPVKLTWEWSKLEPLEQGIDRSVVDGFGQRLRGDWPTKVRDAAHFEAVKREEEEWLGSVEPPANLGRFGGDTSMPRSEATGFFRVECIDGVWWYIDPEGNRFWSVGTTGIRVSDTTLLDGCESFFSELPDRNGPFAEFYHPPIGSPANDGRGREVVSFYLLNVLKKYGSLEAWRDQVIRRFKAWGYNTFGNWSDELMLAQRSIAHTRAISTRVGHYQVNRRMPDIFDERWEWAFRETCADKVAPNRDNPWLLGYFVDNEMPWGSLHKSFLKARPDSAIRGEWSRWAEKAYGGDLAAFNRDFAFEAGHWRDLETMVAADLPGEEGPALDRCRDFAAHYAETYFCKVKAILKEHDPHHLYLGCRFVRKRPHEAICRAAGRHCDVVTVNCYSMIPEREQFGEWHRLTGRPVQIGEHHLPLESPRQCPPLYPAFTADERRAGYERFLREFAGQPWSLGAHWFQHADQNATGRPLDGENQTVGFVDITDRPHPDLVEAAMAVTRKMTAWHAGSRGS